MAYTSEKVGFMMRDGTKIFYGVFDEELPFNDREWFYTHSAESAKKLISALNHWQSQGESCQEEK